MSFKVRRRRFGFSKNMRVASSFFNRSSLYFRFFLGGKKPSNKNRSVGNPEAVSEVNTALGPGMDSIVIFSSMEAPHCRLVLLLHPSNGDHLPGQYPFSIYPVNLTGMYK